MCFSETRKGGFERFFVSQKHASRGIRLRCQNWLRQFGFARTCRLQVKVTQRPREKRQGAGALQDAGATCRGSRSAERLGLRRPSAAFARAEAYAWIRFVPLGQKRQRAGALQDAGATDRRLPRARSVLDCGGPPPLSPARDAHALTKRLVRSPKAPGGWAHSKTLARPIRGPASAERLGLRRPSAAFARARRYQERNASPARQKRQGAGRTPRRWRDSIRGPASAERLGLRRPSAAFARARRSRRNETSRPLAKAPGGWAHSKTLARPTAAPASAERLGLRRPSAAFARARRSRMNETPRPLAKAPGGWAHSKTLARLPAAPASAQRLGLRRPSAAFARARRSRRERNASSARKSARGLGALQDAGATDRGPASAKRLGLRRPSAAFARARRSRINETPRPLAKAPGGWAHSKTLARLTAAPRARSVLDCGGPPPLSPARDAHASTKRLVRSQKRQGAGRTPRRWRD